MTPRQALALAIQTARKSKDLTQEDFGVVSSRTYLSALERGLKSPTIDKLHELAEFMGIHPASLVLAAYALKDNDNHGQTTINRVAAEVKILLADFNR